MEGVEYDYQALSAEHDVVTANGVDFASITEVRQSHTYLVYGLLGSLRGKRIAEKDSHHDAFEAAVAYASRERIGEKRGRQR